MSGQSRPVDPKAQLGGHVLAVCGGIGGAKLALGLYRVLPPHGLTVVVNTGDDFVHLGLHVSPDLDTVLYTLAGWSDLERGWGRADEVMALHGGAGSARRTSLVPPGRSRPRHASPAHPMAGAGRDPDGLCPACCGTHGDRGGHPADVR